MKFARPVIVAMQVMGAVQALTPAVTFAQVGPVGGSGAAGPAGGDLTGTYPNPTVSKVNGSTAGAAANLGIGTALLSAGGNLYVGVGTGMIATAAGVYPSLGSGLVFGGGNIVNNAVDHMVFASGQLPAIYTAISAWYRVSNAAVIDNLEVAALTMACATIPQIQVLDCGTSKSCTSSTVLATATMTSTVGVVIDGTISTSLIPAGDYVGIKISTGNCTVANFHATIQIHAQ